MEKMLFCRVGWMEKYQGLNNGDKIIGGGSYIDIKGYGHEIMNFLPYKGRMYGFVEGGISIEKLGASRKDQSVMPLAQQTVAITTAH